MPITIQRRKYFIWSTVLLVIVAACLALVYLIQTDGGSYAINVRTSNQPAVQSDKLISEDCAPACTTKECLSFSNMLITNMKPDTDPCENFYAYACGNYGEIFGKDEETGIELANLNIMLIALKDILDKIEVNTESASSKMKTVYDSCMKIGSENQALPDALQFLNNVGFGPDWPHISLDFKFRESNLTMTLGKLLAYRECPFMAILLKDVGKSDYEMFHATFLRNYKVMHHRRETERVKNMVNGILEEFDITGETAEEIWNDFLSIHKSIYNMEEKYSNQMPKDDKDIHLNCLNNSGNEWIHMCDILESFITELNMSDVISKDNVTIRRGNAILLRNIIPELLNFTERSLENYLAVHFFWTHIRDLNISFRLKNEKIRKLKFAFTRTEVSRSVLCVRWISYNMYVPLGYEFAQEVLPKEAFNEIINAVEENVDELMKFILKQEWYSQSSEKDFAQKIGNITSSFSMYKNLFFNQTLINDLYKEFHPDKGNFMKNVLHHRSHTLKMHNILHDILGEDETTFIVKGRTKDNAMVLYFGILMGPVYKFGRDRLINLITLSAVLSHEIGHLIHYYKSTDKDFASNFTRSDIAWREKCMEEQYSQFEHYGGEKMIGSQFVYEAYADNVAVQVIDKLIEKYAASGLSLPGFSHTAEQLLYLAVAQIWCVTSSDRIENYIRQYGWHSPDRYRVIGPMQSSESFSRAFNCTKGSYMNPAVKCLALNPI